MSLSGGAYRQTIRGHESIMYWLPLRDLEQIETELDHESVAKKGAIDEGLKAVWSRSDRRPPGPYPYMSLDTRIENLSRVYKPPAPSSVARFLRASPYLVALLEEAFGHIRRVFGSDAALSAEVVVEPDDPDFVELFVTIRVDKRPREAVTMLYEFQDTWFLSVLDRTEDKLNFEVETA